MAKARGNMERRKKLDGLPFLVEIPRPQGIGVWRQLDDMNAWARDGAPDFKLTHYL